MLWIGSALYVAGLSGAAIPDPPWYRTLRQIAPVCTSPVQAELSRCGTPDPGPQEDALRQAANQLPRWSRERLRVAADCALSLQRQCALQRLFAEPSARAFPDARRLLDEERTHHTALRDAEQRLTLGGYGLVPRIALGLFGLIVAWLTVRGLLGSGRRIIHDHPSAFLVQRRANFWTLVAVGTAIAGVTMYLGIDTSHKLSVGSDSYVVSPCAWSLTLLSMIGIVMIYSAPAALFWRMTGSDLVPHKVDPLCSDGQCGVGDYVSFSHLWTILAFLIGIILGVPWIRYMSSGTISFASSYLIPFIAGESLLATLAGRLVYNATVLRGRYRAAVQRLADTWPAVEAQKPAPDPTISFIGENWWKLPATLGAMLLAFWHVLEWTGASRVIVDVVNR